MRQWPRISFACLLAFILVTFVGRTAGAARTSTTHPLACGSWTVVPSPQPFAELNYLFNVSAVSPNDVWAVGTGQGGTGPESTLVEHWDGTRWSVISSPNPSGGQFIKLFGVSGDAANDVWAAGSYHNSSDQVQSLIEHWDGTRWSIVSSHQPGTSSYLSDVVTISTNNAWAVGSYDIHDTSEALIEHWNGTRWSVDLHTHPGQDVESSTLTGITALSASDIWAAGSATRLIHNKRRYTTFTEHWDGTRWHGVFSPSPFWPIDALTSIAGTVANDIWTVGTTMSLKKTQPLAEHWDGSRWRTVSTVSLQNSYILSGVTALAANDAWTVGTQNYNTSNPQTLIEHWDGTSWTTVPSPNPTPYAELFAVTASPDHSLWAVGYDSAGNYPSGPLISTIASAGVIEVAFSMREAILYTPSQLRTVA